MFSMEFEMCFSNVFSLAPEINDFFRCLRLWNFSTGGKATEWSTFLKTGPPKRIYIKLVHKYIIWYLYILYPGTYILILHVPLKIPGTRYLVLDQPGLDRERKNLCQKSVGHAQTWEFVKDFFSVKSFFTNKAKLEKFSKYGRYMGQNQYILLKLLPKLLQT